jgi:hypothetical protein
MRARMPSMRRRTASSAALFSLALGALAGCATPPLPEREVQIAPDLRLTVPLPRELGYSVSVEQMVTARYRGDAQTFEAHLAISPDRLTLIGLDPLGRRLFTLTETPTAIEAAPPLPEGLKVGNVLADIAIVYWPAAAVQRGLHPSSAEIRADEHGRSILLDGREIIRVEYDAPANGSWPGVAHYRNLALGYALDLHSTVTPE